MNQMLVNLVGRIRDRFPLLDVRTDQCDIVRVIAEGVLVGIEEKDGEFIAQVSLDSASDLESKLIKRISSYQLDDFESKVLHNFEALGPPGRVP